MPLIWLRIHLPQQLTLTKSMHISERPIQEKFISADTDNRPSLPILSADISAENYVKNGL